MRLSQHRALAHLGVVCVAACMASVAFAASPSALSNIHHNHLLASTIPGNGDVNPYALAVAPTSAGAVHKGDVLVTNGLNGQVVEVDPATGKQLAARWIDKDEAQILRRGYNYTHGIQEIAERWPPWEQTMAYEAGLLFNVYQNDPRTGFTRIFKKLALIDELNQFTTHIGSALFACPGGVQKGDYIGSGLFTSA